MNWTDLPFRNSRLFKERRMEKTVLTASALIGNNVKNSKGESVAKIEELVIDPGTGRILSAVLSRTDATRTSGMLSTVPWNALTLSSRDGTLYLDIDKGEMQARSKKQVVVYTSSIYRGMGEDRN